MEMTMPRLTKRVVDALEPQPNDYFIWDDEVPGFGVRVFASGKKSYVLQYRHGVCLRRMVIGRHGPLTTEEGRKQARMLRAEVYRGSDPAAARRLERKAITVQQLCKDYLEDAEKGLLVTRLGRPKKATTLATDRGRIYRHIIPLLGKRLVKDLTPPDIVTFLRDVIAGKTASVTKTKPRGKAVVRGGPGTAARTVGLLGAILTYGRSKGINNNNPVHGVQRPADQRRIVRITPEQYASLGETLANAEYANVNPIPIKIARVLLLSGCRRGEIENLRWSEVDFKKQCLVLADTKTGASVRPVSQAVLDLIVEQRAVSWHEYVFSLNGGKSPYRGFPKAWRRIVRNTDISNLIPHALRHGFASTAAELGYSDPVIGALLGHSSGTVTSRYTHLPDATLLHAADRIAAELKSRMDVTP